MVRAHWASSGCRPLSLPPILGYSQMAFLLPGSLFPEADARECTPPRSHPYACQGPMSSIPVWEKLGSGLRPRQGFSLPLPDTHPQTPSQGPSGAGPGQWGAPFFSRRQGSGTLLRHNQGVQWPGGRLAPGRNLAQRDRTRGRRQEPQDRPPPTPSIATS